MSKKEKKVIRPNECSLIRWIMTLVVAALIGVLLTVPVVMVDQMFPNMLAGTPFAFMKEQLTLLTSFIPMMLGALIAIRLVAKTPVRTFIFGNDRKLGAKTCFAILGFYLLGLVLSALVTITTIRYSGIAANQFLIYLGVMLLLVWIQTSFEELIFRGIFLRYACGNEIRMSKKAIIAGVVSSLLFMASHLGNPEVLVQNGVQTVFAVLAYFSTGMCMYMANLCFKSMIPGLLIHWLNNMTAFTILSSEVSAGNALSLFVDYASPTGLYYLLPTLLAYVPLFTWIIVRARRAKKAA